MQEFSFGGHIQSVFFFGERKLKKSGTMTLFVAKSSYLSTTKGTEMLRNNAHLCEFPNNTVLRFQLSIVCEIMEKKYQDIMLR